MGEKANFRYHQCDNACIVMVPFLYVATADLEGEYVAHYLFSRSFAI